MKKSLNFEDILNGNGSLMAPPVSSMCLQNLQESLGILPPQLKALYEISNGLECETWRILPVYDSMYPKKTWDSINKANSNNTKFSPGDDLLSKIIIFGEMEGVHCVFYDRQDSSIWFEDDNGYHQTNLDLPFFIKGMLEENQ